MRTTTNETHNEWNTDYLKFSPILFPSLYFYNYSPKITVENRQKALKSVVENDICDLSSLFIGDYTKEKGSLDALRKQRLLNRLIIGSHNPFSLELWREGI